MRKPRQPYNTSMILLLLAILSIAVAGTAAAAEQPAASEPAESAAEPPAEKGSAEPASWTIRRSPLTVGQRAHVDPETGRLMVPPDKLRQLSPELSEAFSTSHRDLQVRTAPSGYTYVDLRGRFYSATMATVGKDGEVEIRHGVPAPGTAPDQAAESSESGETERATTGRREQR